MSGTSSGGSHTWWAAGPWPCIRATATSSSEGWLPSWAPSWLPSWLPSWPLARVVAGSGGATSPTGSGSSSCWTSEMVKGRMPATCPPSSRRTRARPVGGPDT